MIAVSVSHFAWQVCRSHNKERNAKQCMRQGTPLGTMAKELGRLAAAITVAIDVAVAVRRHDGTGRSTIE